MTDADAATGAGAGDVFSADLLRALGRRGIRKLLKASSKDVHDDSKTTTLPIARDIVMTYVGEPMKAPWYVDLLNLNLNNDGSRRGAPANRDVLRGVP